MSFMWQRAVPGVWSCFTASYPRAWEEKTAHFLFRLPQTAGTLSTTDLYLISIFISIRSYQQLFALFKRPQSGFFKIRFCCLTSAVVVQVRSTSVQQLVPVTGVYPRWWNKTFLTGQTDIGHNEPESVSLHLWLSPPLEQARLCGPASWDLTTGPLLLPQICLMMMTELFSCGNVSQIPLESCWGCFWTCQLCKRWPHCQSS